MGSDPFALSPAAFLGTPVVHPSRFTNIAHSPPRRQGLPDNCRVETLTSAYRIVKLECQP